jgi:hypothetical protein
VTIKDKTLKMIEIDGRTNMENNRMIWRHTLHNLGKINRFALEYIGIDVQCIYCMHPTGSLLYVIIG